MLRIHLFGQPQVLFRGEQIPLPSPNKALALWAYLLLHREQPQFRDHLAYLLWPDVPETEARANLRRHLYQLRHQLPSPPADQPWIITTRHTIQWNPKAPVWLDVALVEKFDDDSAGPAQWQALLEAYRGDLLDGFYDDWILEARDRFHRRFIQLLEARIVQQRQAADWLGAIDTTRRLLTHDPLREEPYRTLMELYFQAGDRAAALREFERCQEMLHQELDAEPMPETLALRQAIVSGTGRSPSRLPEKPLPTPQPPPPQIPPAQARRSKPIPWRQIVVVPALVLLVTMATLTGIATVHRDRQPASLSISGPAHVQDTWLNHQTPGQTRDPEYPEETYDEYAQAHLQYFAYPYDRILVRFSLADLPPKARIEGATLALHAEPFVNADLPQPLPATFAAHRVLTTWESATATFDAPWTQPGLAPGIDYEAQPLDSWPLEGNGWLLLDVTEAVRHWLDQPNNNHGLLLMITAAPQGAHYWVDMTDYPLATRQPRLDITYRH